jgi:hypothetical protein
MFDYDKRSLEWAASFAPEALPVLQARFRHRKAHVGYQAPWSSTRGKDVFVLPSVTPS